MPDPSTVDRLSSGGRRGEEERSLRGAPPVGEDEEEKGSTGNTIANSSHLNSDSDLAHRICLAVPSSLVGGAPGKDPQRHEQRLTRTRAATVRRRASKRRLGRAYSTGSICRRRRRQQQLHAEQLRDPLGAAAKRLNLPVRDADVARGSGR